MYARMEASSFDAIYNIRQYVHCIWGQGCVTYRFALLKLHLVPALGGFHYRSLYLRSLCMPM